MNLLPMTQTAQYRNSQFNNFDNNYRVVGWFYSFNIN